MFFMSRSRTLLIPSSDTVAVILSALYAAELGSDQEDLPECAASKWVGSRINYILKSVEANRERRVKPQVGRIA